MVVLIRKGDAERLIDMERLLRVEQMRLQQEQLRYMRELRTGRPVGSVAPVEVLRFSVWRRLKPQVEVKA